METDSSRRSCLQFLEQAFVRYYESPWAECYQLEQSSHVLGGDERLSTRKVELLHACFGEESKATLCIFDREFIGCLCGVETEAALVVTLGSFSTVGRNVLSCEGKKLVTYLASKEIVDRDWYLASCLRCLRSLLDNWFGKKITSGIRDENNDSKTERKYKQMHSAKEWKGRRA